MFTSIKTKKLSGEGVVMRIFFQVEHSAFTANIAKLID